MATKYHVYTLLQNSNTEKMDVKVPVTQNRIVGYKLTIDLAGSLKEFRGFEDNDYSKITFQNRDGDVIVDDVLNENQIVAPGFNKMDVDLSKNRNFILASARIITAYNTLGKKVKLTLKTI